MAVSKKPRKKASKSGKNRTGLLEHSKIGKELIPPFNQTEISQKILFSSWLNDRLPEMLWAALIRCSNSQDKALLEFRRIITFIHKHPQKECFIGFNLSELAELPELLLEEFINFLVQNPNTAEILSIFRVIDNIPRKDIWEHNLPQKTDVDIDVLMRTIGKCLNHQSQESTDCRWFKVMLYVVSNKLSLPSDMLDKFINYPNKYEQRAVRPSIRACEMALNSLGEKGPNNWVEMFWKELWNKFPCFELVIPKDRHGIPYSLKENIANIYDTLTEHWGLTHTTTELNPKHDGIFGIAFYALSLLDELSTNYIYHGILGRLGLRTLLELRITLKYINSQTSDELWPKWRAYGVGQAKLNALRFDEYIDPPRFIDISTIEIITSEDFWEEFTNISLGNWNNLDLRKMSEKIGLKDEYDKYYSWTSGYSHGTWGAIRETNFEICGNPLHRLHRYPQKNLLPSIVQDAIYLVNAILDDLNNEYPGFNSRINYFASFSTESRTIVE